MVQRGRQRGASRTLQFMMLTGTVVMLSAVPSVYFLGFDPGPEPAPVVAGADVDVTNGESPTIDVTFTSGDTIAMDAIEIVVEAECESGTRSARLTSLPLAESGRIPASAYSGDAILAEHSRLAMADWTAGSPVEIAIDADECVLESGSSVSVEVVHEPSSAVVLRDADSL